MKIKVVEEGEEIDRWDDGGEVVLRRLRGGGFGLFGEGVEALDEEELVNVLGARIHNLKRGLE